MLRDRYTPFYPNIAQLRPSIALPRRDARRPHSRPVSKPCMLLLELFHRDRKSSCSTTLEEGSGFDTVDGLAHIPANASRHSGRLVIRAGVASTHFNLTATATSAFLFTQAVHVLGCFRTRSCPPLSAYISPNVCVASKRESSPSERSSVSRIGITLCKTPGHDRKSRLIRSCEVRMVSRSVSSSSSD